MTINNSEQALIANYKAVRERLMKPPIVVTRQKTEAFLQETIASLRGINGILREELGSMKIALRSKDAEISALKFALKKWEGVPENAPIDMRKIVEDILAEHYPKITFRQIISEDRRQIISQPRNHCMYEVFIARDDITLEKQAQFFNRDHSTYRRSVKLYAASIGVTGILSDARKVKQ